MADRARPDGAADDSTPWRTEVQFPWSVQADHWAWVLCSGPGRHSWHQRLVHGVVESQGTTNPNDFVFAITSPDGDTYCEDYSEGAADVAAVRFCGDRRSIPKGIARAETYRFGAEPAAATLRQWEQEAAISAAEVYAGWCRASVMRAGDGQGLSKMKSGEAD